MRLSSLEMSSEGQVRIHGELTFHTVVPLLLQAKDILNIYPQLVFDMSKVTQTDSAGLALLIECLRLARQKNMQIYFKNMPYQLDKIIAVYGLSNVLPIKNGAIENG